MENQAYAVEEWDSDAASWVQIGRSTRDVEAAESLRDAIHAADGVVRLVMHA